MGYNRKDLKKRDILITAGPTWIPIDNVRFISNISTGKLGIRLAEEAAKKGARVTLLLGPAVQYVPKLPIKVIPFKYLDELSSRLVRLIKSRPYKAILHAAAVADYQPIRKIRGKLKSGMGIFNLVLKPTPKIINSLKRISPRSILVAFKLDLDVPRNILIKRALSVVEKSQADLVVANTFTERSYRAYIVNANGKILSSAQSKNELSKKLIKTIIKLL